MTISSLLNTLVILRIFLYIVLSLESFRSYVDYSRKGRNSVIWIVIANRFPFSVKGELVGAVGKVMFYNPEELHVYKSKVPPPVDVLKYYKTKVEKDLKSKYSFDNLIGNSPVFLSVKSLE